MRMRLYTAEFVGPDRITKTQIMAPTGERAAQLAKDYHDGIGVRLTRISLTRVDDKLPPDQRQGLDNMLETAPMGFASHNPSLGWAVHTVVPARLKLYRIASEDGAAVYVVAPNPDLASAIWLSELDLGEDGTHHLWSISSGVEHLNDRQRTAVEEWLEREPAGVIEWDNEDGWTNG